MTYDAIIVGSGFGGATVAWKLARAGSRVLVLERGPWVRRDESAWDAHAILIERRYRSATPYEVDERWGRALTYPDEAVGGKSVFYGGASFRMRRQDFRGAERFPRSVLDEGPPLDWPITYDELAPYYGEAERLLGVAGVAGADPTLAADDGCYDARPPAYGTVARRIAEAGARLGLKPFPIPLAINYHHDNGRFGCQRCLTCDQFPCQIGAKNDLSVTLLPAAVQDGVEIRDRTVVTRLVLAGGRVRGVECLNLANGERSIVRGDLVVVAAGAIASAVLLQVSGVHHAAAAGNLVGRYLMRHCSGIAIGMFPFPTNPEGRFHKQVAFSDFYFGRDGAKPHGPWGLIQSLQTPPSEYIVRASPYPPPLGHIGARTVRYQSYLLVLAEDLPQARNFVRPHPRRRDPYGVPIPQVFHRYTRRDLAARKGLWREARRILRAAGAWLVVRMPIHTYSHAVGTCRFGADPATSVLDPWCRVWGVPNLFVVDGSFMPSSSGVNPSLTIAANGLRVGEYLARQCNGAGGGRGG